MTQIDDSRYRPTGAAPQPMPVWELIPAPRSADEADGRGPWLPDTPGSLLAPEQAPARLSNGTASFALVMSLLWLLGVGALLGLVFGIVAARECHRTGEPGRGLALAAVVLGLIGLILSPLVLPLL